MYYSNYLPLGPGDNTWLTAEITLPGRISLQLLCLWAAVKLAEHDD
jgi:hypothetical protein